MRCIKGNCELAALVTFKGFGFKGGRDGEEAVGVYAVFDDSLITKFLDGHHLSFSHKSSVIRIRFKEHSKSDVLIKIGNGLQTSSNSLEMSNGTTSYKGWCLTI